jgi:transcriptional regulator with XRE-family HTH domain
METRAQGGLRLWLTIFQQRRVTIMVMPPRIGPRKPVRVYLALWREKKDLTQEQLGERFEPPVDKGTISRWENAKPGGLTLGVIAAYAEALGRKAPDMYGRPPASDPEPTLDELAADLSDEQRERARGYLEGLKGLGKAG